MNRQSRKYILTAAAVVLCGHMLFGTSGPLDPATLERPSRRDSVVPGALPNVDEIRRRMPAARTRPDSLLIEFAPSEIPAEILSETDSIRSILQMREAILDSLIREGIDLPPDSLLPPELRIPEGLPTGEDGLPFDLPNRPDTSLVVTRPVFLFPPWLDQRLVRDDSEYDDFFASVEGRTRPRRDSIRGTGAFLDEIISGNSVDSLVYAVRQKMVYIYTDGDVTYEDMNLKADYMEVNLENKNIFAHGYTDTLGNATRPEFYERGTLYSMDTVTYNIDSKKAKIRKVATQEGDGYLIAEVVKKMPDNVGYFGDGGYTTCENTDHPHFYLAMKKAKVIPGEKVIVGPSHFVLEDVPIRFPLLPFGFFPITQGRKSGMITPKFGEDGRKGFFFRDGGYYWAVNDYLDLTVLGGIYTLGSWQGSLQSRYIKRYRYSGTLNARFVKDIYGEKGSADYVNGSNFSLQWSHQQDAKFRPNSTFSASVNFSTSGFNKYSSTSLQENLTTQTNSSIAYSKSWAGKPFSFNTSFRHSQNSVDSTVTLNFPSATFNVSKVYPFKRRNAIGKAKWYEKISLSYTGQIDASADRIKEYDLFTQKMIDTMKFGVKHNIPLSASWNIFNYINFGPTATYTERWYFRKYDMAWNEDTQKGEVVGIHNGFYRVFNYSVSASASTKVYTMVQMKNTEGALRAVRHVLTPTVSFSYTPSFADPKYGYQRTYQNTADAAKLMTYTPYQNVPYDVPQGGKSASINFSLSNNLEAKIRSQKDTSGVRKIKLIDNLSISSSYNFVADSLNLAPFTVSLKTTIYGSYGLNVNMTLDPYQYDPELKTRVNRFMVRQGKLVRLTSLSTSFGYTFNSTNSQRPAMNDPNSMMGAEYDPSLNDSFFNDPAINDLDPATRRMMMTSQYYDFNIPWNFGFNYSLNYTNPGNASKIIQTVTFTASVTLTEKWGLTFSGFGYDIDKKAMTPGTVNITRDLHCWQMNMSWVPIGTYKNWAFNISVKSAVLRDLKYDKSSSRYDSLYD